MLKEFLKKLCEELGVSPVPKPDEKNVYTVEIAASVLLQMKDLDPGIWMQAKLEECPKQKREDLFIALMQANLLGQGTAGSVIGLDREEKFLTLSSALPYEMSYHAFKENLEDFANYYIYWKGLIEKMKEEAQKLI
jgi:hypothetical protein